MLTYHGYNSQLFTHMTTEKPAKLIAFYDALLAYQGEILSPIYCLSSFQASLTLQMWESNTDAETRCSYL